MEKTKKKKGSALPIVSIILSCVAIVLALAILACMILGPIIETIFAIGIVLLAWGIPLTVFVIILLTNPDEMVYSTVPIYGGCQITSYLNISGSDIEIPQTIGDEQVISIGQDAFNGYDNLTSVTLPYGLKNIEARAFAFCTSLETIVIPDTVEYIGDDAFLGCSSLKSIEIGSSTRFIGNNAFADCTSLETVTLKIGLEEIGMQAFYGCTSLRAIEIPISVFKIGMGAFSGCDSMTSAMIYGSYKVGDITVSVGDFPNAQDIAFALKNTYSQYTWEK